VFTWREPWTRTSFQLFVKRKPRTEAALAKDAAALAGLKPGQLVKVLRRAKSQGFAWQVGYYGQPRPGKTVSVLLLRHGTKPIVYVLVMRVALAAEAVRHMAAFSKAYQGLKAKP
jgi:hypothetical protein